MQSIPVPTDLIGPNRVAEILCVNRATVYRMLARGELTAYRITSGLTKVSEMEVRAHVEVTPTSLDIYVRRIVDAAPALNSEQLDKLRSLLA